MLPSVPSVTGVPNYFADIVAGLIAYQIPNVNTVALPPPLVEPADREQDTENNCLWP